MHRAALTLSVLLFTASCQFIPGSDAQKIAEAEKLVSAELAGFEGMEFAKVTHFDSLDAVCGGVRVRKPDGDMTNYRRFVVSDGEADLEPITDNIRGMADEIRHTQQIALFESVWQISCDNP